MHVNLVNVERYNFTSSANSLFLLCNALIKLQLWTWRLQGMTTALLSFRETTTGSKSRWPHRRKVFALCLPHMNSCPALSDHRCIRLLHKVDQTQKHILANLYCSSWFGINFVDPASFPWVKKRSCPHAHPTSTWVHIAVRAQHCDHYSHKINATNAVALVTKNSMAVTQYCNWTLLKHLQMGNATNCFFPNSEPWQYFQ